MVHCWNCHREHTSETGCWVCSQRRKGKPMEQDEKSTKSTKSTKSAAREEAFLALHDALPGHYSSRTSTDITDTQSQKHPRSFIETSSNSGQGRVHSVPPVPGSRTTYPSSISNYDFTRSGGPVVSFIKTSGVRTPRTYDSSESLPSELPFGSIEIIPHEELPPPDDDESRAEKKPASAAIDVRGWRRGLLVASVLLGMFLGFLDTTIVSVALPTIASDFEDYARSTWVVTAYLLTYMGKSASPFVRIVLFTN